MNSDIFIPLRIPRVATFSGVILPEHELIRQVNMFSCINKLMVVSKTAGSCLLSPFQFPQCFFHYYIIKLEVSPAA